MKANSRGHHILRLLPCLVAFRRMARKLRVADLIPIVLCPQLASQCFEGLSHTTEIAENGIDLPRNITARRAARGTKYAHMATHHGSGLHRKEVFNNIAKELNEVYEELNRSQAGRARAIKVLKRIGSEIQLGKYPGMINTP